MINKKALLALINLDLLDSRPNLSKTAISRKSDEEDDKFAKVMQALSRAILNRGTGMTLDEEKKIYKLFYIHAEKTYFLGQEYSDKVLRKTKPVTTKDIERIEMLAKESMGKWLKLIKGAEI